MNRKMSKRQRDIKSKLMAAICMLLVSSIMMVSTTYAWFTLSTAPEVTGINTAVGANGNLEMALLPANGLVDSITSSSGDGAETKPITEKNVTWGNLVDLGSTEVAMNAYGLNKITLYPSEVNIANDKVLDIPLKTPVYGADGRVKEVLANTLTATYVEGAFNANTDKGVRAIGVSSGMSERELIYRNALSTANTAMGSAATKAKQALEQNGTALASIAVSHGLDSNAKFALEDVQKLDAMLTALEGSMEQIDNAYKNYILAFAASNLNTNELAYTAVKGFVETAGSTTASVLNGINGLAGENVLSAAVPDYITTGLAKYTATVAAVTAAQAAYDTNITGDDPFEWSAIADVVNGLADSSKMTVNGMTVQYVKDHKQELIDDYLATNKLTVAVGTGAGVFADVADQSGDYKAQIRIEGVKVGDMTLNTNAWMETKTDVKPAYLAAAGAALTGKAPAASGSEEKTLSEMYGYIIDMAFRTNAADSDLQLQVDAVDRIYSDQTGAETMGHGSSMTFEATTTDLTQAQIRSLMDAIRIIFFDPNGGTIIAKAKLDAAAAETTAEGLTAKMYLYTDAAGEVTYDKVTDTSDAGKTYYKKTTQTVYTKQEGVTADNFSTFSNLHVENGGSYTKADAFAEGTEYYAATQEDVYTELTAETLAEAVAAGNVYVQKTTGNGFDRLSDTKIMGLTQNQATALSVLVYLDGTKVTNADVAFSGSSSMTGTMNLQFSSSATLVPMEYRALHQGTVAEETTAATTAPATTESTPAVGG